MQKRIALSIVFLGFTFLVMQPVCAANPMAGLPDVTGTPLPSQMAEFKRVLLGKPTLDELNALQEFSLQFSGAADEGSERALLGRLFTAQRKMLQAQRALKDAMSSRSIECQKLDELSARIQELENAIEGVDGKAGLRALLNEKDQEITQLKQTRQQRNLSSDKLNEAAAEIAILKRYATKAKIGIGCLSAFIIVDKVIIPIIKKCRSAWKKRQDKHKRPDAWTALRSRFEKKM